MNILDSLKKPFFYKMHPEAAIRYAPIVKLLKKQNLDKSKILEVGSGSLGIAPYLKKQVVGLDLNFDEGYYPNLKQVKGSADKIPFKAKKFDVVIMSDVLEHLPNKMREKCMLEAIRVSKKAVVISGPFGHQSALQDKNLAEYSLKKLGKMHPYFEDHLKYGLPEVDEIKTMLGKNKKIKDIKIVGEYFNLSARNFLMKLYITNNKLIYYFYLKCMMIFVPIFILLNKKPCYRSLILVKL